MRKWTRAANYAGENFFEYFILLSRHRDSDILTNCNFDTALERLGGESEESGIIVEHARHWAVGWIQNILVHEKSKKLKDAQEIFESLENYPVLDDCALSDAEYEDACETIANNMGHFENQLADFLGLDDLHSFKSEDVQEFISEVYFEDSGYRGADSAWVDNRSIKRVGESEYPNIDEKNPVLKAVRLKVATMKGGAA